MLEPAYRKTLDHNYIVFPIPEEMDIDYQINMISENNIPGLIRLQPRYDQDGPQLYYEISSLQPLKRMYEHRTINDNEIRLILGNILNVYRSLRDYMLDDSHLLLMPEYIYVDAVSLMPSLIFLPFYEQERNKSLLDLCEYFMSRSSHDGNDPDMLSYRLYHLVRLENIVPADIQKLLDEPQPAAVPAAPPVAATESVTAGTDTEVKPARVTPCTDTPKEKAPASAFPLIQLITAAAGLLVSLLPSGILKLSRAGRLAGTALMITGLISFFIALKKKKTASEPASPTAAAAVNAAENEFEMYFSDDAPAVSEDASDCYSKTVFIESDPKDIEGILIEKTKKEEYPLNTFPFTIGKLKERVDLELKDRSVSRIHARILKKDDKYYLQDCGSTNGTFINGIQLQTEETVPIEKDDEIGIGRVRFVLA